MQSSKIPIQPKPLEICCQDPFANDQLDRKEPIETLTSFLENVQSPCILSVDAPWGAGKTTFLRMWDKYLESKGFFTVNFNAWEVDFSDDPFLALSSEITTQLTPFLESKGLTSELEELTSRAKEIIANGVPNILSTFAAMGATAVGAPLASSFASDLARKAAEKLFLSHENSQSAIDEFRSKLASLAEALADDNEEKPVIIVIDELDRCRPTFAIELLEVAKHIFGVRNVIFVLSTNRQELAQSVRAIYGDRFRAEDYLERFFDTEFNLPHLERREYIVNNIESTSIGERLQERYAREAFVALLNGSTLNLRSISKAVHHLNLVATSSSRLIELETEIASILVAYRAISHRSFQEFLQGRLTDAQTTQNIFAALRGEGLRNTIEHAVYEAVVWSANLRIKGENRFSDAVLEPIRRDKKIQPGSKENYVLSRYISAVMGDDSDIDAIDIKGLLRRIELLSQGNLSGQSQHIRMQARYA